MNRLKFVLYVGVYCQFFIGICGLKIVSNNFKPLLGKTCFMCKKSFSPLQGTSRGLAWYDEREPLITGEAEPIDMEWFDLCWDCAEVFDRCWKDMFKLYPYNKEGD